MNDNSSENSALLSHDDVLAGLGIQEDSAMVWWTSLVGPMFATLLMLVLIGVLQGWDVAFSYITAAATAFFALGRFVIIIGGETANQDQHLFLKHLNARHLFWMLTWLDMMVAIFVAFHMAFSVQDSIRWTSVTRPCLRRTVYFGEATVDPKSGFFRFGRFRGLPDLDHRQHWRHDFWSPVGYDSAACIDRHLHWQLAGQRRDAVRR